MKADADGRELAKLHPESQGKKIMFHVFEKKVSVWKKKGERQSRLEHDLLIAHG